MSAVGFLCYIFRMSSVNLLLTFNNLLQVVSAQSELGGGPGTSA